MNHLPEILRVVSQLRDPKLEVINEDYDQNSPEQISKLYYGFKSGDFKSDQEASSTLYSAQPTDSRYTTLKGRLRRRLLNSLFLLDLGRKGYSKTAQALYRSNKRLFMVKTLITLGARGTAITMAEAELEIAREYALTSNTIELLLLLRTHKSLLGKAKQYEEVNAQLNDALRIFAAECRSWELYERTTIKFATKEVIEEALIQEVQEYAAELAKLRETCDSSNFMMNYFRVSSLANHAAGKFLKTIEICEEATKYLESNPLLSSPARLGEFALTLLACFRNLRDYQEGRAAAARCARWIPKGSNTWFFFNEDYFLLAMNTLHFDDANTIYKEVSSHPRIDSLPEHRVEKWKIFEAYLKYAIHATQLDPELPTAERPQLRMKTFLRSVATYSKDKKGLNVAVLILQILYLLDSDDFDAIISRMEALRTYRGRYLRSNTNRQSALFFKMLQIMENNSFSYKLTKEKTKKYADRLKEAQDATDISEGLQIIPFEWLWAQIMVKLKAIESGPKSARID